MELNTQSLTAPQDVIIGKTTGEGGAVLNISPDVDTEVAKKAMHMVAKEGDDGSLEDNNPENGRLPKPLYFKLTGEDSPVMYPVSVDGKDMSINFVRGLYVTDDPAIAEAMMRHIETAGDLGLPDTFMSVSQAIYARMQAESSQGDNLQEAAQGNPALAEEVRQMQDEIDKLRDLAKKP